MINVTVSDSAVTAKFNVMPEKTRLGVERTIYVLVQKLRSKIVREKLMGQVLNRRTGRLGQSIQDKVSSDANSITGIVYSSGDVKYARIHEYGGKTAAHIIEPKKAQALYFNGTFAKKVNHPGSNIPERSYMRSSLAEMREEIAARLRQSVGDSTK
jgi:phage gpG-like protein